MTAAWFMAHRSKNQSSYKNGIRKGECLGNPRFAWKAGFLWALDSMNSAWIGNFTKSRKIAAYCSSGTLERRFKRGFALFPER